MVFYREGERVVFLVIFFLTLSFCYANLLGMKRCPECKIEKSSSEFHRNKFTKSGLSAYCKSCMNIHVAAYRASPKGKRTLAAYGKSVAYKEAQARYRSTPKYKEWQERYHKSDKYKAMQLKYRQSERGKKQRRADWHKYVATPAGKMKARVRENTRYAIKMGRLIQKPCQVCGGKAEAHHLDYAKPLHVEWLCKEHHREVHR